MVRELHEAGSQGVMRRGSGVYKVNTHSNSVLVLGLRLLKKSFRVHLGQLPAAWGLWTFAVG